MHLVCVITTRKKIVYDFFVRCFFFIHISGFGWYIFRLRLFNCISLYLFNRFTFDALVHHHHHHFDTGADLFSYILLSVNKIQTYIHYITSWQSILLFLFLDKKIPYLLVFYFISSVSCFAKSKIQSVRAFFTTNYLYAQFTGNFHIIFWDTSIFIDIMFIK